MDVHFLRVARTVNVYPGVEDSQVGLRGMHMHGVGVARYLSQGEALDFRKRIYGEQIDIAVQCRVYRARPIIRFRVGDVLL